MSSSDVEMLLVAVSILVYVCLIFLVIMREYLLYRQDKTAIDKGLTYKLNADKTVAVSTGVRFNRDMSTCPRGVKLQLLGAGGVAVYSEYNGDDFWKGWSPTPGR